MYVTISLLLRGDTDLDYKRMLKILQQNEGEEFLTYYPEMAPLYFEVSLRSSVPNRFQQKARYENLLAYVEKTYQNFKDITNDKEFALSMKSNCPVHLTGLMWKVWNFFTFFFGI